MKEKLFKIWRKKDHPITIVIVYWLIFSFLTLVQPLLDYIFKFDGNSESHFIAILIVSTITTLFIVKRYRDKVDDKVIYEED